MEISALEPLMKAWDKHEYLMAMKPSEKPNDWNKLSTDAWFDLRKEFEKLRRLVK